MVRAWSMTTQFALFRMGFFRIYPKLQLFAKCESRVKFRTKHNLKSGLNCC